MAYGRLDVFWPDGRIESHFLEADSVSIGRTEGNTIALDTDTISRYHFVMSHKDEQVFITDLESANGTHVDGKRIPANEPFLLGGTEEIMIGHLRIIYQPIDESPTMPMSVVDGDTTQRIEKEEANFHFRIDHTELSVWPASSNSTEILITNNDEDFDLFIIQATGLPTSWVNLNHSEVYIPEGESMPVLINVKPIRHSKTTPGSYPMKVQIMPKSRPDILLETEVMVHVKGFSGFGMALANPHIEDDEDIRLYVHNQGSENLSIRVRPVDKSGKLSFGLPSAPMTLTPGQRLQVTGNVKLRNPSLFGSAETYPFEVAVQIDGSGQFLSAVPAKVTLKPRVSKWMAISAAGIALSILAIAFVVLLGILMDDPEPQISQMSVNSNQIQRGQPIVIEWIGSDIEEYRVQVNGTPVLTDLDSDTNRAEITDTSSLPIDTVIQLQGINGGVTTIAEQQVQIYVPAQMEVLSITPSQIVRNVINTSLNIQWDAPNAQSIRFEGLDEFATTPIQDEYSRQGSIRVSGIATQPFEIVIYVEDEAGNIAEVRREIQVIDAQCQIQNADVSIHLAPNAQSPVTATLPNGDNVLVNSQNAQGSWLQVQLAGGNVGWGQKTNFLCADNFDPNNLRIETNIPVFATAIPSAVTPRIVTSTPVVTPAQSQAISSTATTPPTASLVPSPTATLTTD